jgi:iron(III) transport system permease protein
MCAMKRIASHNTITIFCVARTSLSLSNLVLPVFNTVLACGLCLLLAVPIGTLLAILLVRSDVWGRRLARIALVSQLAIPLYVFAGSWAAGIGLQGWMRIDYWLGPTGISWMQGWFGGCLAVSLIHAMASIPWVCLIISLGLIHCDRNEEETALLEGGWSALVMHVWLPRLRIWLWVACWWCALGLLTEMVVSNLYMFRTVAEMVYLDVSRDTVSPLTYIVAMLLCTLPILAVGVWLTRHLPSLKQVLAKPQHFHGRPIPLGRFRLPASLLLWSLLSVLVILPIINLVIKAGWTPRVADSSIQGHTWTARRFLQTAVESFSLFSNEFYWSIMLALASSVLAILVSASLYAMTSPYCCRQSTIHQESFSNSRRLIHLTMLLMVALPGPLVGKLLTFVLNRPGWLGDIYYTTLTAPLLAQQFRLLPLAWLMMCGLVASVGQRSWELAQSDGLRGWQLVQTLLRPALGPKIVLGWGLLMLMSVGELSCSMGVLPPGVTTTSMRLFEILHFGMRHQDSGLCGLLILLSWTATALVWWASRRRSFS